MILQATSADRHPCRSSHPASSFLLVPRWRSQRHPVSIVRCARWIRETPSARSSEAPSQSLLHNHPYLRPSFVATEHSRVATHPGNWWTADDLPKFPASPVPLEEPFCMKFPVHPALVLYGRSTPVLQRPPEWGAFRTPSHRPSSVPWTTLLPFCKHQSSFPSRTSFCLLLLGEFVRRRSRMIF